ALAPGASGNARRDTADRTAHTAPRTNGAPDQSAMDRSSHAGADRADRRHRRPPARRLPASRPADGAALPTPDSGDRWRIRQALPPGAEGLVVLDHFQGNRTPYTDAQARGVISGLTLKHGPAHLYRAMIEGVSFGTALIFQTMRANGFSPQEVVVCGGSTLMLGVASLVALALW